MTGTSTHSVVLLISPILWSISTESEVESILNLADIGTAIGLRDRAILETLYSTGMRRLELIGLKWSSIDYERGTVFIDQGKGKKDRMITQR